MSLTGALYTGVTGLQTLGHSLQVTGNNIANVNTVGYRSGRAQFSDLLYQTISLGGQISQIGRGTQLETITRSFAQGSFRNTDSVTDLAISGGGFFYLSDGVNSYYTRAGNFHISAAGLLVNPDDLEVQGFLFDSTGQPTGAQGSINLSNQTTRPQATTNITVKANLDAEAEILAAAFDKDNPTETSNYSTSIKIYDSLGKIHNIAVYFKKTVDSPGTWEWHAVVDPSEVTGGVDYEISGTLVFGTDGTLTSDIPLSGNREFDFIGAESAQVITFDFGDPTSVGGGTGMKGLTQYAGSFVTNFQSQDGYQAGNLQAINLDSDGYISGVFSNGRTRRIAQVAVASFQNDSGLSSLGSNMFVETVGSGPPSISAPKVGSAGEIIGNALELSNVDLSTEFVTLITDQRAFQANSRVITTTNELLQEVVNLVR